MIEKGKWPNRFGFYREDLRPIISSVLTNCHVTPDQVGQMTEVELLLYADPKQDEDGMTGLVRLQVLQTLTIEERIELARRKYDL